MVRWTSTELEAYKAKHKQAIVKPLPLAQLINKSETYVDKLKPGKRVRQSSKPLMNKLEAEWFSVLESQCRMQELPRAQAVRFKLCNGVTYSPDFFHPAWDNGVNAMPTAWEVKGKHAWDDAIVKIKMAAHEWPEIQWMLVWKESGIFQIQEILP